MKQLSIVAILCMFISYAFGQHIGINNTDPQVSLDISGAFAHRGVVIDPFMNNVNIPLDASYVIISNENVTGPITVVAPEYIDGKRLVIQNVSAYIATFGSYQIPQNEIKEFICRDPGGYILLGTTVGPSWSLSGNSDTNPATHFIGTTDAKPLQFKVSNSKAGTIDLSGNTAFGFKSLNSFLPLSIGNSAFGEFSLFSLENGEQNTALGYRSMIDHKNGSRNIAIGVSALEKGTNNDKIVAIGLEALYYNDGKGENTAIGTYALKKNGYSSSSPLLSSQGVENTAIGSGALSNNTRGSGAVVIGSNAAYLDTMSHGVIAIGRSALYNNQSGKNNFAIGDSALVKTGLGVTSAFLGSQNMGLGKNALLNNISGNNNLAIGYKVLEKATTNNNNMAIGNFTLSNITNGFSNTAIGYSSLNQLVNGSKNTALNSLQGLTNGSENIGIGSLGSVANKATKNILIGYIDILATALTDTISNNVLIGYRNAVSMNGHKNVLIGNNSGGVDVYGTLNSTLGDSSLVNNRFGSKNVAVGAKSGGLHPNGSGNVFIGYSAGAVDTGSNKLYIENSNANKNNALIYGDFAADSLLLNGKTVVRNNAVVQGFSKLGGYASDVPSIKMKKIVNTGPALNGSKLIAHGLNAAKILEIEILMEWQVEGFPASPTRVVPPNFTSVPGLNYQYELLDANIIIYNINGTDISGRNLRILITYEE